MTPESRQRIALLLRQLADEFQTPDLRDCEDSQVKADQVKADQVKADPVKEDPPEVKLKKLQELGAKAISSGHRSFLVSLLAAHNLKALSAADPSLYDELIRSLHERLSD